MTVGLTLDETRHFIEKLTTWTTVANKFTLGDISSLHGLLEIATRIIADPDPISSTFRT